MDIEELPLLDEILADWKSTIGDRANALKVTKFVGSLKFGVLKSVLE